MKTYKIASPDEMREIIPIIKDEDRAKSAGNVAKVWSVATRQGKQDAFTVFIRLGRSAGLYRLAGAREVFMGDMRLKQAREFAGKLEEI